MAAKDYIKNKRLILFVAVLLVFAVLDAVYGIHLGIDFAGGTQIPVELAHSVNPDQMSTLIGILNGRVSAFGLKQVTVEGVGDSEVYVIIPSVSGSEINSTINIIQSQGVFDGVVSGKEALNGSGILSGSIGAVPATQEGNNVSWAVNFFITNAAEIHFNKIVFGQANQPIYMFLDRPSKSIILMNTSLISTALTGITGNQQQAVSAMDAAVALGNQTMPVELLNPTGNNWGTLYPFFSANTKRYSSVILAASTPVSIQDNLTALGYTLIIASNANMTPTLFATGTGITGETLLVDTWPSVGLLSAPILSPSITNGSAGLSYQISGFAPSTLPVDEAVSYANNESKTISSILSGGALPVPVIVDTPTTVDPTLGSSFLFISAIAAVLAIVAVALVIVIRYRKLFLIIPILLTTLAELFIVVSIIGLVGSIDLAAVAGMIAVVGTGVDAQIIITDEVLAGAHHERGIKARLSSASYIIWMNAILLVIAMLPLLFSTSLVTIVGFAESTIIGALLGVIITRPAYAALLTLKYGNDETAKKA